MSREDSLVVQLPWIPWQEPVRVTLTDGSASGWACRFCIALHGLRSQDVPELAQTEAAVAAHIRREHPLKPRGL